MNVPNAIVPARASTSPVLLNGTPLNVVVELVVLRNSPAGALLKAIPTPP